MTRVKYSDWAAHVFEKVDEEYASVETIILVSAHRLKSFATLAGGESFTFYGPTSRFDWIQIADGMYQYNRLPFGVASAPLEMNGDAGNTQVAVCIDDLWIWWC